MKTKTILIVEDEENIAEVLIAYSQQQGYHTQHLDNGAKVLEFIKLNTVDLVLLDLMLPEVDGLSLCKQIRDFSNLPIIMVTAKQQEQDRLIGLESGADDYIVKPFSPKEVMARIKAVLRRTSQPHLNTINHAGFQLNVDGYVALLEQRNIDFTAVEFKIFLLFITHIGRVFTREDIIQHIYQGDALEVSDRNIDTHIKNIRKKINAVKMGCNPIASVYGVGYKFID
ncbi:response regulator [Psychromonas sp. 14N.309.X.WAT.B.A12]|uniref:response regulator n=1 Tax=unclassified Psychromonas TaxID=2614957 RepID=UPI0025B0953F|nr:response regulator [Psychromonas sp. 14N.309.X.WAT.B.A12]MDN2662592.1 response regulator [Psychromonas sp. 14N.309.X.WAT.B.A12]